MPLKDLLVHVGNDPACSTRIDVAARLAAYFDASLTGLHVSSLSVLTARVEAQLPPSFHAAEAHRLRDEAAAAQALFASRTRAVGARSEWRAVEGPLIPVVLLHARYVDLTILGQGLDLQDQPMGLEILPEELIMHVGRPVLVVPRYGTFPGLGDHVLVAWNGSREATRAVNDALPILERAAKVSVLSVDPDDGPVRRWPGADIVLHLARHGVRATAAQTVAADISVGDALLSYAADIGADLIVAGAYGHSRLRELILGGATRHLLQHMTVPVFLSH